MVRTGQLASLITLAAGLISLTPTDSPHIALPSDKDERTFANVEVAGSVWHGLFSEAQRIAKEQDKPILHFQMFGRLDDAYC
jgi:hypothetical protein